MALSELLNPAAETHKMFDASDQEIYEAVMESKQAQESSESTRGEAIPTRAEALQAAWVSQKYTEVIDSTFVRKFESMLGAFWAGNSSDQRMQDSKITDHFPCK
jgi:hypothetical protein